MTIHGVSDLGPNVGHEGRFERFIEFAEEYGLGRWIWFHTISQYIYIV